MASKVEFTVFLGNLRKNIRITQLKQNIIILLREIGVEVQKFDIDVRKGRSICYAFVNLDNGMEEQHVIHTLLAVDGLNLKNISLDDIVSDGLALRVAKKRDRIVKEVKDQENEQRMKENQDIFIPDPDLMVQTPRYMNPFERPKSPPMGKQKYQKRRSKLRPDVVVNKSLDLSSDSEKEDKVKPSRPNYSIVSPYDQENREDIWQKEPGHDSDEDYTPSMKNQTYQREWVENINKESSGIEANSRSFETTSPPGSSQSDYIKALKKKYPFEHLMFGEHVGVEDRNTEFKEGGGSFYLKKKLKEHTGKYVVSFLNSDGGTLWIGVNDEGKAIGVKYDQKHEDKARIIIDNAIKAIRPNVFPDMYSVSFIPLTSPDSNAPCDHKVIRIQVQRVESSHLYETKRGEVFIRRDGSVQGPLKAREIQEWTEARYRLEEKRKEHEIANLHRLEAELRGQLEERDRKTEELNETLARLEYEYKQSKVCVLL